MKLLSLALSLFFVTVPAQAQVPDLISEFGFETLSEGQNAVAPGGITLEGPTTVTEELVVQGTISAEGAGYRFADGTLQETAATSVGLSSNQGLYENRIVLMTPSLPFTEVCFKSGGLQNDIHSISESTMGGNCVPGDLGWIIERDQRTATVWASARVACLLEGMRLPEAFEWLFSCSEAGTLGLIGMTNDWEWGSNSATPQRPGTNSGSAVAVLGGGSCGHASYGWAASSSGSSESYVFRCVR